MEKKPLTSQSTRIPSHFKSLASYLQQCPANVDFKLYDWLRTLALEDLGRMHKDGNSIYDSFVTKSPMTKAARDFAKAACLAYCAEAPDAEPEMVTKHLDTLLRGMRDAAYIEIMVRCGWAVVTERISIWPRTPKPYQVSQRGREEGERLTNPRSRTLLGLPPKPRLESVFQN
jgi:hypothetical protein